MKIASRRFAKKSLTPLLSGAVALQLALSFAPQAQAAPQQAKKADDFVESIGVCTHVQNYNDADWNTVKSQLGALGVRYYREGLELTDDATYKARMQGLYDSYGMKMLAVTGPMGNSALQPTSTGSLQHVADKIASIKPFLLAVEGPNEPEYFWYEPWNYGGFTDRASQVVWYQNKLYDTIKADSRTIDVQVASTALARPETYNTRDASNPGAFDWINTRPLIKHDILAWHYYNGRQLPTPYGWLDLARNALSSNAATKPAYLTEHGYRVRGDGNVTQKAQMKLNTRSMAFFWGNSDVINAKVFFYVSGRDTAAGEDYGLSNQDFTPRPTFNSLKSVISYLKEGTWNTSTKTWSKPNFTPGSLDWNVTGQTGDYGWRLLQKSTGEFYLIALPYIQVSNNGDGSDITNVDRNVTLSFPTSQKIVQYKTDDNGNYSETTLANSATSVNVALNDTLVIFKISATGTTPPVNTNLLSNPSFDVDTVDTQTPSGWSEWNNTDASYTETYGGSRTGARHGTHWRNSAYEVATLQVKTGLANGNYTFRAWVKSGGAQPIAKLYAQNYGGAQMTVDANTAIGSWTQITLANIPVSNGQCEVGFWSRANAGQWLYFDDAEFFRQGATGVPIGQRISLKSLNNNLFVMSDQNNGGTLRGISSAVGSWEKFDVVDAGAGLIALRAAISGQYVQTNLSAGNNLIAQANTINDSWQKFTWQDLGNSTFALKANNNGLFVQNNTGVTGGTLIAQASTINDNWQKFVWAPAP